MFTTPDVGVPTALRRQHQAQRLGDARLVPKSQFFFGRRDPAPRALDLRPQGDLELTLDEADDVVQLAAFDLQALAHAPLVASTLDTLGRVYSEIGRLDAAQPLIERSLAINEARLGKEHPSLADALVPLADIHLQRHAPKQAIPLLERAIALYLRKPGDPAKLADARFSLAQALVAAGEDRRRAVSLADEARAGYLSAGPRAAPAAADVNAWLAGTRR